MAIETSAGWVVYTGDLRRHGQHGALTETFIKEAAALRPIALLCEGTNIAHGPGATEEDVRDACLQAVQEAAGEFVVADFGPRNVERLLTFLEIARRTNRRLVITDKDAYLLTAMHAVDHSIPTPASDKHLVVYRRALVKPDHWVKRVREWYPHQVKAADVGGHPGDYIVCFSFFDITELVDIDPAGGIWIYSSSEPHDEEQLFGLERLENWLRLFQLRPLGLGKGPSPYHASGHISGPEMMDLVRKMAPGRVIPVHTEDPDRFLELTRDNIRVDLPQVGVALPL
jgi:ribonuclease J